MARASASASAPAAERDEQPAKKRTREEMLSARATLPRDPTPAAPAPPPDAETFTCAAWNVGGLRAWLRDESRKAELVHAVTSLDADLVCVLETKLQPGEMEVEIGRELTGLFPDYTPHFTSASDKKGYSGLCALLRTSRIQEASVVAGMGTLDGEGRVLTVTAPHGPSGGLLHVVCACRAPPPRTPATRCLTVPGAAHAQNPTLAADVPNAGDGLKRLDERVGTWDRAFARYIKGLQEGASPGGRDGAGPCAANSAVAVVGDLNVAHLDEDIWNWGQTPSKNKAIGKQAGTSPQERESFSRLLDEAGMADAFRHRFPTAKGAFTYWSVRANGRPVNRGLRLDYCLVSKQGLLAGPEDGEGDSWRFHDVRIWHELNTRGDHCPVALTLVRRTGQECPHVGEPGCGLAGDGPN